MTKVFMSVKEVKLEERQMVLGNRPQQLPGHLQLGDARWYRWPNNMRESLSVPIMETRTRPDGWGNAYCGVRPRARGNERPHRATVCGIRSMVCQNASGRKGCSQ